MPAGAAAGVPAVVPAVMPVAVQPFDIINAGINAFFVMLQDALLIMVEQQPSYRALNWLVIIAQNIVQLANGDALPNVAPLATWPIGNVVEIVTRIDIDGTTRVVGGNQPQQNNETLNLVNAFVLTLRQLTMPILLIAPQLLQHQTRQNAIAIYNEFVRLMNAPLGTHSTPAIQQHIVEFYRTAIQARQADVPAAPQITRENATHAVYYTLLQHLMPNPPPAPPPAGGQPQLTLTQTVALVFTTIIVAPAIVRM